MLSAGVLEIIDQHETFRIEIDARLVQTQMPSIWTATDGPQQAIKIVEHPAIVGFQKNDVDMIRWFIFLGQVLRKISNHVTLAKLISAVLFGELFRSKTEYSSVNTGSCMYHRLGGRQNTTSGLWQASGFGEFGLQLLGNLLFPREILAEQPRRSQQSVSS